MLALYERHYSARQYRDGRRRRLCVGPGQKLVLVTGDGCAAFAWRKFLSDNAQTGVNCAFFRNEGPHLSSLLIADAVAHARERWPLDRFYTYVDPSSIRSKNPGACFKHAGWRVCGQTKGGHGRSSQAILEMVSP